MNRAQAINFLQNVLKIPHVEMKLDTNRLILLNDILRAFYAHIPYQSIKLLSIDYDKRVAFSPSEYIGDCLSTLGGSCHVVNSFMNCLLVAMGYKACLQGCKVNMHPSVLYVHCVNLVFDVMEMGDVYLVDSGALYPTFEAVPLHNLRDDGVSKVYHQSYQEARYLRDGDTVTRCHRRNKIFFFSKDETHQEDWFKLYYFTLAPVGAEALDANFSQTYSERSSGCFRGLSFALYPYGKAVALKNHNLYVYDEETGTVQAKRLDSPEDIAGELAAYCPGAGFTAGLVGKALGNAQVEKEFRQKNSLE